MKAIRHALALGLLLAGLAAARAAASDDGTAAGWSALENSAPKTAQKAFTTVLAKNGGDRAAQFGLALSVLDTPPLTDGRIADVRSRLEKLAAGGDEIARAARYFLGRIAQLYLATPDYAAAVRDYEALADAGTADHWGGEALVELALLRLYVWPAAATPAERLAAGEALLAKAAQPGTRRDLHLILAEAVMHYGGDDRTALAHLEAAEKIGGLAGAARADTLVQIAELARLHGEFAVARAHYEAFAREFPHDVRRYLVLQRLAALPPAVPGHGAP